MFDNVWPKFDIFNFHQTCLKCNKICLTRVTHNQTLLSNIVWSYKVWPCVIGLSVCLKKSSLYQITELKCDDNAYCHLAPLFKYVIMKNMVHVGFASANCIIMLLFLYTIVLCGHYHIILFFIDFRLIFRSAQCLFCDKNTELAYTYMCIMYFEKKWESLFVYFIKKQN